MFNQFKSKAMQMHSLLTEKLQINTSHIKDEPFDDEYISENESLSYNVTKSLHIEPVDSQFLDDIKLEMLNENSLGSDIVYLEDTDDYQYCDDALADTVENATEEENTSAVHTNKVSITKTEQNDNVDDVFKDYVSTSEDDSRDDQLNNKPMFVVSVVKDAESEEITCTICKKIYPTIKKLKKHWFNQHTSENIFECPQNLCSICGVGFVTKKAFRNHRYKAHLDRVSYVFVFFFLFL